MHGLTFDSPARLWALLVVAALLAAYVVLQRRRTRYAVRLPGLDLLDDPAGWRRPLSVLAARHDVVVAHVVDRRELTLPAAGALRLVDPETGRQLEVASTPKLRQRYAEAAEQRLEAQRTAVRSAGAAYAPLRTDEDWLPQLAHFLATRRRTRAAARPLGAS